MKRGFEEKEDEVMRIKRKKGNRMGISFDHACSRDFCHPENEPGGHVYVCDHGAVHVCTSDECNLAELTERGEWVCPISGAVIGVDSDTPAMQRDDEDGGGGGRLVPLGWHVVKPKTHPVETTFRQRATAIVELLFFGRARSELNARTYRERARRCSQQTKSYEQEQNRTSRFVSLPYVCTIAANSVALPPLYAILPQNAKNAHRISSCVHVIEQVYTTMILPLKALGISSHPIPRPDQCIYGVLALMVVGHELVHFNAWVHRHLPDEQDISAFKDAPRVNRKEAKNLVVACYESARLRGIVPKADPLPPFSSSSPAIQFKPTSRGIFCNVCKKRGPHACKARCEEEEEEENAFFE
jgi:hypothetical protein